MLFPQSPTKATKVAVLTLFRRNGSSHSRLKEEKVSLAAQVDEIEEEVVMDHGYGNEKMHTINLQPELIPESFQDRRDEEWTAIFKTQESRDPPAVVLKRRPASFISTSPRNLDAIFAGTPTSTASTKRTSNRNFVDSKDAIIAKLKAKCRELRAKILQYGDVDRYSETEVTMKLEREKYKLKKELTVIKSQLKFTNNALEDAVQKLQDGTCEKAKMAETIDNQADQIHDYKVKIEILEREIRQWKLHSEKLDAEKIRLEEQSMEANSTSAAPASVEVQDESSQKCRSLHAPVAVRSVNTKENKSIKNEDETGSNPFEDDSSTSSYRNPFDDDDLSSQSQIHSQIENRENSTVTAASPFTDMNNKTANLALKLAMKTQMAELQAKFAHKMSTQLSKIAELHEENDMKDMQIKNLMEKLEQYDNSSSTRSMFGTWGRKVSNEAETDQCNLADVARV